MFAPPRPPQQRKLDALRHLQEDTDVWVASSDAGGTPCLVPLCFWWNGETLLLATPAGNPTGQNMIKSGEVRAALGLTRDVVLLRGSTWLLDDLPEEDHAAYVTKCGWDPQQDPKRCSFFRLRPDHIESWRELNEHPDRELMHDGHWTV